MGSTATGYNISFWDGLVSHGRHRPAFVRDQDEMSREHDLTLEAKVHSGDYFVALATRLDQLSQDVSTYRTRIEIEDIVSELLHLQSKYSIVEKNSRTARNISAEGR